jgi:hypothetical protein
VTFEEIVLCVNMANAAYFDNAGLTSYLAGIPYTSKVVFDEASTSTQGFVVWNLSAKVLVVSFRGTLEAQDWQNNLNPATAEASFLLGHAPATGLAPKGFADAYLSIRESVWTAVQVGGHLIGDFCSCGLTGFVFVLGCHQ